MNFSSKYSISLLVLATVVLLYLLINNGYRQVINCHQLNGTYWRSRDTLGRSSDYDSYHDQIGLIQFKNDSVYSGQTGNAMSYTCDKKNGKVGSIATFKIENDGTLIVSVMTIHVPFLQISKEEFNSIMEQNKLTRKKINQ